MNLKIGDLNNLRDGIEPYGGSDTPWAANPDDEVYLLRYYGEEDRDAFWDWNPSVPEGQPEVEVLATAVVPK